MTLIHKLHFQPDDLNEGSFTLDSSSFGTMAKVLAEHLGLPQVTMTHRQTEGDTLTYHVFNTKEFTPLDDVQGFLGVARVTRTESVL